MTVSEYWWLIAGMTVATFVSRYPSLWYFSRRPAPNWLKSLLDYLPSATLSAVTAPLVFSPNLGAVEQWPVWLGTVSAIGCAMRQLPPLVSILIAFAVYFGAKLLM